VLARRERCRARGGRAHIAVAALFANAVPYLLFTVAEQTVDLHGRDHQRDAAVWTVVLALAGGIKIGHRLAGRRADRRVHGALRSSPWDSQAAWHRLVRSNA
jgi:hypothetical protein